MASGGAQQRHGSRQFSEGARSVTLILLAPVFLLALPCLYAGLGARVDRRMQWPPLPSPPLNLIVGLLLILAGLLLGLWSNYRLFTTGRGTPLPAMPTQQLIVEAPYTYCRNPMALGAIGMYMGVAIVFRSPGAMLLVLLSAAALLTYIRIGEERTLAARFGWGYADYRRRTPFLIPRPRGQRPVR
jgi:protein-S-isoprenylcysteine O-methyltransferase Ste14